MKPHWLRPQAAAEYLSISRPTLYLLKGSGVIKFYKIGGVILVKVSELDEAVEKGVQK